MPFRRKLATHADHHNIQELTMFEQAEGTVQKIAGNVQDAFGSVTGDVSQQFKGKARHAAGAAQDIYGEALDQVRKQAMTNPLVTVAVIAGLAFVVGSLWSRR